MTGEYKIVCNSRFASSNALADGEQTFVHCAHPAVSDPVMGDHGKLYVKPELVPCYKEDIVRLASIMTPNQFEAEQLVGQHIITEEDALAACQTLHDRGPSTVVCALYYHH